MVAVLRRALLPFLATPVGRITEAACKHAAVRAPGRLVAVSDLHVGIPENRAIVLETVRPTSRADALIVAGDVAERADDVLSVLAALRRRFATVVWVPGNHELWTMRGDPVQLRGVARYDHLVARCREIDVVTPEDPFPVWTGAGGPATIAPLFLLYDYTFLAPGTTTKAASLEAARWTQVVCADESLLHSDPYPSRDAWCRARVAQTVKRLEARDPELPTVLVNHFPLVRDPTRLLRHQQFAQWCGTTETADWHRRFRAKAVVYGHLHIPRTSWHDGVPFVEASLGYPRERRRRRLDDWPRPVFAP